MTQTIEIPEGFELKKVSDTEYRIVKKEKFLPKTWEEFCEAYSIKKDEYFIGSGSELLNIGCKNRLSNSDKNILPSKEKAEAILALCQLIQLCDCYNDGWKPDWFARDQKYTINIDTDIINHHIIFNKGGYIYSPNVLAFRTEELRDEFLNNFKDLIEKLKPLYE